MRLLPPSPEAIIQGVPRIEQLRCLFEMASHSHLWRVQAFRQRAAARNSQTPLHGCGRELAASKHPWAGNLQIWHVLWPLTGQGPEGADVSGTCFLLLPPSDCGKPSVAHRHTGKQAPGAEPFTSRLWALQKHSWRVSSLFRWQLCILYYLVTPFLQQMKTPKTGLTEMPNPCR